MKKIDPSEIRSAVIEEFAEKLKAGLGGCRLVYKEEDQGYNSEDVHNLINIVIDEMEREYVG